MALFINSADFGKKLLIRPLCHSDRFYSKFEVFQATEVKSLEEAEELDISVRHCYNW